MSQMKGQGKTPEKQLSKVETGRLPEKEFRIMIMKMIQDLRKTKEKMQECCKVMQEMQENERKCKDIQELKTKQ